MFKIFLNIILISMTCELYKPKKGSANLDA